MAGVQKVNPLVVVDAFEQVGKKITWFNVTYGTTPTTGPEGTLQAAFHAIQTMGIIVVSGPITSDIQSMGVEGEFSAADLTAMEAEVVAIIAGSSVAAKTLVIA